MREGREGREGGREREGTDCVEFSKCLATFVPNPQQWCMHAYIRPTLPLLNSLHALWRAGIFPPLNSFPSTIYIPTSETVNKLMSWTAGMK